MNTYELMLIINPQLSDAEIAEAVDKAKKILTDEKAEVLAEDRLGRMAEARHDEAAAIGSWEGDIAKVDIAVL